MLFYYEPFVSDVAPVIIGVSVLVGSATSQHTPEGAPAVDAVASVLQSGIWGSRGRFRSVRQRGTRNGPVKGWKNGSRPE